MSARICVSAFLLILEQWTGSLAMNPTLTRRSFLQKTSLGAVGFSMSNFGFPPFQHLNQPLAQGKKREIPTVCALCSSRCLIKAEVVDGRLLKIKGNGGARLNGSLVCARAQAAIKLVYDPDRLKFPMKRVGPRGRGEWVRIEWSEALDRIAGALQKTIETDGPEAVALLVAGPSSFYITELFRHLGVSQFYDSSTNFSTRIQDLAYGSVFGPAPGAVYQPDYDQAHCLVCLGFQPGENVQLPELPRIIAARERGLKAIVVDPRFSAFANKADYYLPIKPGTDTALIYGWLNYIIEYGLYDKGHVRQNIAGFSLLSEHLKDFTLSRVAKITGINKKDIEDTAREIAKQAPAVVIHSGRHHSTYGNDVERLRAQAILMAVLGSFNAPGSVRRFFADNSDLSSMPMTSFSAIRQNMLEGRIKTMGCWGQNPLQSYPSPFKTIAAFKRADFIFVADVLPSETTLYADIILPEASFLERHDIVEHIQDGSRSFIAPRLPALDPAFASRPPYEIVRDLAGRLGEGDALPEADVVGYLDRKLEPYNHTLASLAEKGGVVETGGTRDIAGLSGLTTASGRMEVMTKAAGFPELPAYTPVAPVPSGYFRLLYGRSPVRHGSQGGNNPWLAHEQGENQLWLNDRLASYLGLSDGAEVVVENQDGIVATKAISLKLTPGIRKDCVYLAHGFGCQSPFLARAFNQGLSDTWLMSRSSRDPVSGVRALGVNYVRVRKVDE